MPVIYLNDHRKLTEEQRRIAVIAAENEINDVMADMEIMDEQLQRTVLFRELSLMEVCINYINNLKMNKDGTCVDDELLKRVCEQYFPE